jgi:hypothetical protein
VFHVDVAKVDRDVAMVVHVCCKRLLQMLHLFFQTYVASVFVWMLHICFKRMLQVFLSGCCVLPLSCNIVHSSLQNLSSNIIHSRGQKPIFTLNTFHLSTNHY